MYYYRCDKLLKVTLFKVDGELYASLAGLSTTDVAYAQQAAADVEITVDCITVNAEIIVDNKELNVINVKFNKSMLKPMSSPQTVPVHFIVKHSYFKNLHCSLDRISSDMVSCLIPSCLKPQKRKFPRIPWPTEPFLWLDKEYQLLALKKMMVCDNTAPFLLNGPFGTGKTRVLATAAITFLKRPANRVLICTSHLQSADAYIDNYFGPMVDNYTLPHNVDPIRLVGDHYKYSGNYEYLCKNSHKYEDKNPIRKSRLVISTFLTVLQLINLNVKCYTHILIDEGAQKYEPETVAPLGLANDNTKIVIAGDHLQVRLCISKCTTS